MIPMSQRASPTGLRPADPRDGRHACTPPRGTGRVGRAMVALVACTVFAVCTVLAACAGETAPRPKGVLLLVVDTLRADALSLYGYERATSPRLDRFAAERGVVFEHARAAAPWTKPSIASIMTGLEPRQHGVMLHHHRLHGQLATLGAAFQAAGYDTAAVQSNMLLASVFGYSNGFSVYLEEHLALHSVSTGEQINADALGWLDGRADPARPWFMWVHHYEPHFDYLHWPGLTFETGYTGRLTGSEPMDQLIAYTEHLGPDEIAFLRGRYDGEVLRQDQLVGDLLDGLAARGELAETLVVFTSDHGEEFLEHGELSHQHKLFDVLLHVPLVIARPGESQPGHRIVEPVSLLDLGRTMLDLAGETKRVFPGHSFAALMQGSGGIDLAPSVAHTATVEGGSETEPRELDMLFMGSHKLVRDLDSGERLLFDLARDPKERRNLAAEQPERTAALERELERFLSLRQRRGGPLAAEHVELTSEQLERLAKIGYGPKRGE